MTNPWLARFSDVPSMIAPERLAEFEASLAALAAHPELGTLMAADRADSSDEFWTELGRMSATFRPYVVKNGVLLVPVKGVLLHDFPYAFLSYATGYEYIGRAVARGVADDTVKGIALIVNSPGGEVAGNFDLVDKIFAGRGLKPITAICSESAYSAAYSIASAASTIVAPRTGGLGSIGVVTAHVDFSAALEDAGVKITLIYAGKHKVDGHPYAALPDDVRARIQARVDRLYGIFADTVARNRNLDAAAVRDTEALTYTANEAMALGLADKIGAPGDALAEFEADVTNPQEGDETMTTVTVASVKTDHAEVANALIAEGNAMGKAEAKAEHDKAMTSERARVAKLDGYAAKYAGNEAALKIISEAKSNGTTAEATADRLIEQGVPAQAAVLAAIKADDKSATGATAAAADAGGKAAVPQTPEGWKAEYEGSKALQGEFLTVGSYVAFKKRDTAQEGAK